MAQGDEAFHLKITVSRLYSTHSISARVCALLLIFILLQPSILLKTQLSKRKAIYKIRNGSKLKLMHGLHLRCIYLYISRKQSQSGSRSPSRKHSTEGHSKHVRSKSPSKRRSRSRSYSPSRKQSPSRKRSRSRSVSPHRTVHSSRHKSPKSRRYV